MVTKEPKEPKEPKESRHETKPAGASPGPAEASTQVEPVAPADLPAEVRAAVEELEADPGAVIDFKVYPDRVVLVLFDYRKYTFSLAALASRIKQRVGK